MVATQIVFLFSPLFGEDSHFDWYFSKGLKPPTPTSYIYNIYIYIHCRLYIESVSRNSWLAQSRHGHFRIFCTNPELISIIFLARSKSIYVLFHAAHFSSAVPPPFEALLASVASNWAFPNPQICVRSKRLLLRDKANWCACMRSSGGRISLLDGGKQWQTEMYRLGRFGLWEWYVSVLLWCDLYKKWLNLMLM